MFRFWQQLKHSAYFQRNKVVLVLLFCWLFRLCFLLQGQEGSVAINKYSFLQAFLILLLGIKFCKLRFYPSELLKYPSSRGFTLIYILGALSICWSVMPIMSFYFAVENIVCMLALLYLSLQCRDCYEAEIVSLGIIWVMIGMFLARFLLLGGDAHSVTYSTVSAILTTYCAAELRSGQRPALNEKMLKYSLYLGIFMLIFTTSSGAVFSTALTFFVLSLFAKSKLMKVLAVLCIIVLVLLWVSGATDQVIGILFPGKSIESISTAHGRTVVWEMINDKVRERPLLGWGYCAIERVLPIYCVDTHNSVVGIRGALGNLGCVTLIIAMLYQLLYFLRKIQHPGCRGLFAATVCSFINSNTSNFLASKAGPAALTFQILLVLGAAYSILPLRTEKARVQGEMK